MAPPQGPLQAILHEIVCGFLVADQPPRIAPQGRYVRLDLRSQVAHVESYQGWATCHTLLLTPSPVVSPGLLSLTQV
jgi:hypothetical protein